MQTRELDKLDIDALLLEAVGEQCCLRALARSVEPLENDERAPFLLLGHDAMKWDGLCELGGGGSTQEHERKLTHSVVNARRVLTRLSTVTSTCLALSLGGYPGKST